MKFASLGLVALLFVAGGGDHERGVKLLADGKFGEAAAAFRKAIEEDGATAELSYNLALALWRAGEADEAETYAEKAATLSDGEYSALRDGLLGNLRFDAATALPEDRLEEALSMARQARSHYLRGAVREGAPRELARNLERAEHLIDELEKKLEEQQQEEEKKDEENKPDEEKKEDEKKEDEKTEEEKKKEEEEKKQQEKKDEEKKDEEKKGQEQKQDGQLQEGQPEEGEEGEPQGEPEPQEDPSGSESGDESEETGEPEDQPQPGEEGEDGEDKPAPAPGEQGEELQLSPEEKKRLMDLLDQLDEKRQQLRARQKARRPKVEKDW